MGERLRRRRPLRGRDGETATFAAAWADPSCQAVVINGPAGVGKSRLAEEFLTLAVRKGWRARRATTSAEAAAVPFGAIAHLLPAGVDLTDPVKGFAQVARAVAGRQRDRRWAVLVDDLHLLDAASTVLLRQLMDGGAARLIATVRSGEPVNEAVDALTGGAAAHWITLGAFDHAQMQAALEAALGGPVGRRALHELYTASGGNALYLRELVLGAVQSGALAHDGEIWELAEDRSAGTPRLAEAIGARLAAADRTARPVLDLLALCGPLPLADAEAAAPLELLAELEELGLIRVTSDRRRTTVRLAHPLYAESLREGIPARRRRALLLEQAERTQSYGARRRDDARHIAEWHLTATGTADAGLLVRAAALAWHSHDYPQTAALLQALPERRQTTATRLMLGSALRQVGRAAAAEAILAEADAQATAEPEKLVAVFTRTVTLSWSAAKPMESLAAVEAARRTVTSPGGRAMLAVLEGSVRILMGQLADGTGLLEKLDDEVQRAPDANVWVTGAMMKSGALALRGRTADALVWAERTHEGHVLVAEQTMGWHPAASLIAKVLALTEAGRPGEAREVAECAFTVLADTHAQASRVWFALNLGRIEWLTGHPAEARRWYAEACRLGRTAYQVSGLRLALGGLAASAALLGDTTAARAALSERDGCPRLGFFSDEDRLGDAWLLAARGRLGEARAVLLESARTARETGHTTSESLLLTDVARLSGAHEVADRLMELAAACDGTLAPARARLAAAVAADDPDALLSVSGDLEALGADLLAAEAASAAAEAWRRAGRTRQAAAATQRARACAARCPGARTPLLTTAGAAAELTAREREIALLAATGTASKDIAGILHLSVRTVDNHLQRAYTKLGVSTRRELAHILGGAPGQK